MHVICINDLYVGQALCLGDLWDLTQDGIVKETAEALGLIQKFMNHGGSLGLDCVAEPDRFLVPAGEKPEDQAWWEVAERHARVRRQSAKIVDGEVREPGHGRAELS